MNSDRVIPKYRFFAGILSILICVSIIYKVPIQRDEETSGYTHGVFPLTSNPNDFVSIWDTTAISIGSSNMDKVKLPLIPSGIYNFTVKWGDGKNDTITEWNQPEVTHTYDMEGIKTITINGTFIGWCFNNTGDKTKIYEIPQWGGLRLGNTGGYFHGCVNLEVTAIDSPNLTGTTSLHRAFSNCENIGHRGSMNAWDVSNVTDMSYMFYGASSFHQPLDLWNVSSVTNMCSIFRHDSYWAPDFNSPIENWDVSSVVDMSYMFSGSKSFYQPLDGWDVSRVTTMEGMFKNAEIFNLPLNNWNVSNVIDMSLMFFGARAFNQPLGNWNVSKVMDMSSMFKNTWYFNQPIGSWNVSKVTDMNSMFEDAIRFNQPIGNWDVSNVKNMQEMFYLSDFNLPLENWDVSNVTNMKGMFMAAHEFNQPLNAWDVSSVEDMHSMFAYAFSFNQPLGSWNVSNVKNMGGMFLGATLSTQNYDNLLIGWSQLELQHSVAFNGGYSIPSSEGAKARRYIIRTFSWEIKDEGRSEPYKIPGFPIWTIILMIGIVGFIFVKKRKFTKIRITFVALTQFI